MGSATYMTIGAATAIGTMRAIDRDLERMEGAEPTRIAEIEGENRGRPPRDLRPPL